MAKSKIPNEQTLLDNLGKIAYTLDKTYISRLSTDYAVYPYDEFNADRDENGNIQKDKDTGNRYFINLPRNNIRLLKVDRWIFDKEEKSGECFKNVLSLFADGDHTIALVIKRTQRNTEMYFAIKNDGMGRNEDSSNNVKLLEQSIKGNFPGSNVHINESANIEKDLEELFSVCCEKISDDKEKHGSIALLENSPSAYSEDYITQRLDKLINGIVPDGNDVKDYCVVFLAESLTQNDVSQIMEGYEEMATAIHPFLEYQFQMGSSKTNEQGEMQSISDSDSISDSVFKSHNVNIGANGSYNQSKNKILYGAEKSLKVTQILTNIVQNIVAGAGAGASTGLLAGGLGALPGAGIGAILGLLKGISSGINQSASTPNGSEGSGWSAGGSLGYGYGWGNSKTITTGKTTTKGTSSSIALGESENTIYNYKSYTVANLEEKLEKTMKRIKQSQATGLWKYATYVLSGDSITSKNVANYLRAVTQGKESYIEPPVVQEWSYRELPSQEKEEGYETLAYDDLRKYITNFTHPIFVTGNVEESNNVIKNGMFVTPTSYVGTDELSNVLVFPRKSVPGIPIVECASFGRNEAEYKLCEDEASDKKLKNKIKIGNIVHMLQMENCIEVNLDLNSLCSHTFITGSTGSGKSNTVYQILNNVKDKKYKVKVKESDEEKENDKENEIEKNVTFLVIEPAKGEYKKVFGNNSDVQVYGTNPSLTPLLKINPFSFPNEYNAPESKNTIHILEHLDRLVEIFNVCWPMYAAMPAVLKEAVEKSYEDAGWDLTASINPNGELYPTFADVAQNVKLIIDTSEYDAENKGAYKGSLLTRLKSLTNGLNGQIFTNKGIEDSKLFDENVIIDLSRVGSQETKSLLMGVLVLKLQEHRMAQGGMNSELKHITVLEEAHNLLKRTSTEQVAESANLVGKSVEMLTNAIAEMRTYGEGFIIADQAPALLDMAVIRNTNTKIIMRLPDLADRELVGKAANLNDDQITELAKLPTGVAAVYQNEWVEAVLCKVDKYNVPKKEFLEPDNPSTKNPEGAPIEKRIHIAELISKGEGLSNIEAMKELNSLNLSYASRAVLAEFLRNPLSFNKNVHRISPVMREMFPKTFKKIKETYENHKNSESWTGVIQNTLNDEINGNNINAHTQHCIIQALITQYVCNDLHQYKELKEWQNWAKSAWKPIK